jgi:hypothetical protein
MGIPKRQIDFCFAHPPVDEAQDESRIYSYLF